MYCSKKSLEDPKGKTSSEYESCIFRGVRSTVVVVFKSTDRSAPRVEVAKASAHNVGILEGMTLHRMQKPQ